MADPKPTGGYYERALAFYAKLFMISEYIFKTALWFAFIVGLQVVYANKSSGALFVLISILYIVLIAPPAILVLRLLSVVPRTFYTPRGVRILGSFVLPIGLILFGILLQAGLGGNLKELADATVVARSR